MSALLSHAFVKQAFKDACFKELRALKPGNVHVFAEGHEMTVADFERSAVAAAPVIAQPGASVGRRIRDAVFATFEEVGCNTNLGIILLCAPLAVAAGEPFGGASDLKARLSAVLAGLTLEDAELAFQGIARANPAGLGSVRAQDVHEQVLGTLREAMALAADRDRIARAYATDFEDIFQIGLAVLRSASQEHADQSLAVTQLHMTYFSEFPDSHIARKHGPVVAEKIMNEAGKIKEQWEREGQNERVNSLIKFDTALKQRGLNPGTTADLVVATLFADRLQTQIASPMSA